MNNPQNETKIFPEKEYFYKILVKIVIIIFVLSALFLLAIYFISKETSLVNQNTNKKALTAIIPLEPANVYRRSGTITEIKATFIKIQSRVRTTSNDPNQAYEIKTLTVYVDDNTIYTKKDYQNFNQTQVIPQAQTINKNNLRVGDLVNVKAGVNIKDSTSFTATEIEKIVQ